MSLAGTLVGIENINPGQNFGVKPFLTAGITDMRDGDRMRRTRSLGAIEDYDGGVDAKYGVTKSLTLDLTYHTDFAQVEADTQQVNLTRFNLILSGKTRFLSRKLRNFQFRSGRRIWSWRQPRPLLQPPNRAQRKWKSHSDRRRRPVDGKGRSIRYRADCHEDREARHAGILDPPDSFE